MKRPRPLVTVHFHSYHVVVVFWKCGRPVGLAGCGGGSVAGMGTALASGGLAGLTRTLGSGYQGPPALTVARAFTQWTPIRGCSCWC